MLARSTGIELNHVPYKGSAPLCTDLLGGHMPFAVDTLATYLPYLEDGRLRTIGVTSAKRLDRLPHVPTVAEQGVDGFEATLWYGVVGPRGLSQDIADKIAEAIKKWLDAPATRTKFAEMSIVPIGGSSQELRRAMDKEINSLRPIVESGALQPN
jgi:tripartite-type tricarboxylate transporter receptor subunit TctC